MVDRLAVGGYHGRKIRAALETAFDLERIHACVYQVREQLQQLKKMGPLGQLMDLVPGMSQLTRDLAPDVTDQQMKAIEAIINSMTREERRNPRIINASRKRRIANGSGRTVMEVNDLLSQFREMQKLMKQVHLFLLGC